MKLVRFPWDETGFRVTDDQFDLLMQNPGAPSVWVDAEIGISGVKAKIDLVKAYLFQELHWQ